MMALVSLGLLALASAAPFLDRRLGSGADEDYGVDLKEVEKIIYDVNGIEELKKQPCEDKRFDDGSHGGECPEWLYLPNCRYLPAGAAEAENQLTITTSKNLTEVLTLAYDMGAEAFQIDHDAHSSDGSTVFIQTVANGDRDCHVPSKCIHWPTVDCTPLLQHSVHSSQHVDSDDLGRPGLYIKVRTAPNESAWMSEKVRTEFMGDAGIWQNQCMADLRAAIDVANFQDYFDNLAAARRRNMYDNLIVSGVLWVLSCVSIPFPGGALAILDAGAVAERLAGKEVTEWLLTNFKKNGESLVNFFDKFERSVGAHWAVFASVNGMIKASVDEKLSEVESKSLTTVAVHDALFILTADINADALESMKHMPNSMLVALGSMWDNRVPNSSCTLDGQAKLVSDLDRVFQGVVDLGKHTIHQEGGSRSPCGRETIWGLCHFHNSDDDHGYQFCHGTRVCCHVPNGHKCPNPFEYFCDYDGYVIPRQFQYYVQRTALENNETNEDMRPPNRIDSVDFGDVHCKTS